MESKYNYSYDSKTNTIHKDSCTKLLFMSNLIRYPNLSTAIRKNYIPCECCEDDYVEALINRNIDIISRSKYNFIYSPNDPYFHSRNCTIPLYYHILLGSHKYETPFKKGKKPCLFCNPTPREVIINDTWIDLPSENKNLKHYSNSRTKEEIKAVTRFYDLKRERDQRLSFATTKTEKDDIYTLTQPRFSFLASKGYNFFHKKTCPTIKTLSHYMGFRSFDEAVKCGFKPCRKCKPTPNDDIKVSIPLNNQIREYESITDLKKLCLKNGFYFLHHNYSFTILTIFGKWRIDLRNLPFRVEHINLKRNPLERHYHIQPRLFLSYEDIINYIKRHDDK